MMVTRWQHINFDTNYHDAKCRNSQPGMPSPSRRPRRFNVRRTRPYDHQNDLQMSQFVIKTLYSLAQARRLPQTTPVHGYPTETLPIHQQQHSTENISIQGINS
jgi:hypothetical protein